MNGINFSLVVLLQRIMELLALYLILANMNGRNLKEAFRGLWRNRQRIYYENMVVFIGYVVGMTVAISVARELAYLISHVLLPFIGLFLVKRPGIRQGLLSVVFMTLLAAVVILPNLIVPVPGVVNFGVLLVVVIWLVSQHYLYKGYAYLSNKKFWLNTVSFIAFIIYGFPFVFTAEELLFLSVVVILFLLGNLFLLKGLAKKGIEKELAETVDLVSNSSYDGLLLFLEEISCEYTHSEFIHHFVIYNIKISPEFMDALSERLTSFEKDKLFRNYTCHMVSDQIKISVIL